MTLLHIITTVLLVYKSYWVAGQNISCRNLQNASVDWFIMYKLPDINANPDKLIQNGVGFLYLDDQTKGKWVQPKIGVNDQKQPLAYTLQQIYTAKNGNDTQFFHILYNDEWPDTVPAEASRSLGHTKGAMMFDKNMGFWLVHSAPKFPPQDKYDYPVTATKFGQSVLCISLAYSTLNTVARQLLYNQPAIYDSNLDVDIGNQIPNLQRVLKRQWQKLAPFNKVEELRSLNGKQFSSYAKHKKWNKELYSDFVAPNLGKSLLTETWQNGRGNLQSNCSSSFTVNNVELVKLQNGVSFLDTKDHSKWAVSTDASTTCIGDINRQKGQYKRSGGTICFKDEFVSKTFKDSVARVQNCPVNLIQHDPGLV